MNNCKIVTVCSSNVGRTSQLQNSFIPFRHNLTKETRAINNTAFSSILKPVPYSELKDHFPTLVRPRGSAKVQRNGSLDSDQLRREINAAILLVKSRNENGMTPHNTYPLKTSLEHVMSRSEMHIVKQHEKKDEPHWNGARIVGNDINRKSSMKCHLRMLTLANVYANPRSTTVTKSGQTDASLNNCVPDLVISSSNSLTNSITIDDLSGFKETWILQRKMPVLPEKCIKESSNLSMDPRRLLRSRKSREDILRQYMDVYMHWRTINAIEEHQRITNDKSCKSSSAKIRNATPKQRLEQFQKTLNEKKSSQPKKNSAMTRKIEKEDLIRNQTECLDTINQEPSIIVHVDYVGEDKMSEIFGDKYFVEEQIKYQDKEDDTRSDTYSEIDWLECEDI